MTEYQNVMKNNLIADTNDLTTSDVFKLMDLYFYRKGILFRHPRDSYDKFIDEDLKNFLENQEHVITESLSFTIFTRIWFKFANIKIQEPMLENGVEPLFPSGARHNNLTYSLKVFADVSQFQDTTDILTDETTTVQNGVTKNNILVAIIPLMVGSKYCNLNLHKGVDKTECEQDPRCYFIVKGGEKVIISQDAQCFNKCFVYFKKDVGYFAQVNSKSYRDKGGFQSLMIRLRKLELLIKVPILNEINAIILIKALGIEIDKHIVNYIVYDQHDTDMFDILRVSLDACKNDRGNKITTQDDAIDYLITKMKVLNKKITETNKDVKHAQKKKFLLHLLKNNLLPHVGENSTNRTINKAYFICYMINKLIRVELGRIVPDDRDSYVNKRVELPGDIIFESYKQNHKKMIGECKKYYDHRTKGNEVATIVIDIIKPNIIEQGINGSLSTGKFMRKNGVAQILQRITYLYTISLIRRIDAPSADNSTNKLTSPRHIHPSSVGFLCVVETTDHKDIGLVKQLTLLGSVTIMTREQYNLIGEYLLNNVTPVSNVVPESLRDNNYYKVFFNGDWIGLTYDPYNLVDNIEKKRFEGTFDIKNTSVIRDDDECEIRVYCDSGRLNRPVITVENNVINLKKKHISNISLNKSDKSKITSWDQFLINNPGVIDYIDVEKQPYSMISHKIKNIEEMRQKMQNSILKVQNIKSNHVENRYDDMYYTKYNYCEFHPSLLIGNIIANVPFYNRNPGQRNMMQYAQGRQAMTIYATNYRNRLDISYILYKPQRSLVYPRASIYTGTRILPTGENCLVAIGCYTGYNQEDSLIFNGSAVQRGKFRAMSVKKFGKSIQKNQSTAQDDIFTKPDPTKVSGQHGSYDKLNDMGYINEETIVVNNDVIFGKITPVSNSEGEKPYRDTSEIYKVGAPGIVDKVYLNTSNSEGYEMRKCCVRSERIPKIGDKYCCYDTKTKVLTINGWKYFYELDMNDKVATLINNDTFEYRNITEKFDYDYEGPMYKVENNKIDLLVTPNHRMYVKYVDGEYNIMEANEIVGKQNMYFKRGISKLGNFGEIFEDVKIENCDTNEYINYCGKVYCCKVNSNEGLLYVMRNEKTCWSGNSVHGQKGTVGIILDEIDMPFNKYGLKPDIILSPCAIPSRMTIGQLIECIVGKAAILQGMDADGTQFEDIDINKVGEILEKFGYEKSGNEELTCGLTGEVMNVKYFFGPTYYQRLKQLVQDKIHCLTMDHEVLTENGWKTFPLIKEGEKIACLEDGKLVYQVPKLLFFPDYKGKMYRIETMEVNLNVTCNHRMYVTELYKKKYRFEKAEDIFGKCMKYKRDAIWEAPDYQFILPEMEENKQVCVHMDSWLVLFGLWMSRGVQLSKKNNDAIIEISARNEKAKMNLKNACKNLGYEYIIDEDKDIFKFYNPQVASYVRKYNTAFDKKYLPEWVWNLSARQSQILLEFLFHNDRYVKAERTFRTFTSSTKYADDLTRVALHAGVSATKSLKERKHSGAVIFSIGLSLCGTPSVNKKYKGVTNLRNFEEIYDYEGPVFCMEVPSEVFYVRRHGWPIWTGNSRSTGLTTSLVRQAPEGRAKDGGLKIGEMERDALIAHGMSKFLKEKLLDNSDAFIVYVCDKCGLFAQRFEKPENKTYSTPADIYYCPSCQNMSEISKIRIPYAFKLLIQELMALNIKPKIVCKKNNFE